CTKCHARPGWERPPHAIHGCRVFDRLIAALTPPNRKQSLVFAILAPYGAAAVAEYRFRNGEDFLSPIRPEQSIRRKHYREPAGGRELGGNFDLADVLGQVAPPAGGDGQNGPTGAHDGAVGTGPDNGQC